MTKHRIYSISVASVYPHYVAKAEKKGRTKAEVDEVIRWLTGHSQGTLDDQLAKNATFEDFFAHAPRMNPSRSLITGVICGVRVEDVQEPTMREIRYLDKLIDELSKGRAMEKIFAKVAEPVGSSVLRPVFRELERRSACGQEAHVPCWRLDDVIWPENEPAAREGYAR